MLRVEINALCHGRNFILESEDEITTSDLIKKIHILLDDIDEGVLISCDKKGVLPKEEKLSRLGVASGELLLYLKKG